MKTANYDDVKKTISSWIVEEGSLKSVAKRLNLDHSALYRVYNGKENMTLSRWEKWKDLWNGRTYRYDVKYFRTEAKIIDVRCFYDIHELSDWFTRQNALEATMILEIEEAPV